MTLDIVFVVVAALLLLAGFVGTVVPVLPGTPLAWCGLLCAYFSKYCAVPIWILVATGFVAATVSVLDNIMPIAMTKKSGGSKWGMWGSTIGLIVGLFAGPLGILVCPFFGALIGELFHDSSDFKKSLNAAFGAFKGFLAGIGIKMAACSAFIWVFIWFLLKSAKGTFTISG